MVARLSPLWHNREEGLHCPYALQHLLPLHSVTFQPFLLVYKKELGLRLYVTECVWVRFWAPVGHINPISHVVFVELIPSRVLPLWLGSVAGVVERGRRLRTSVYCRLRGLHIVLLHKQGVRKYNGIQNFTRTCKKKRKIQQMKMVHIVKWHQRWVEVGRCTYR